MSDPTMPTTFNTLFPEREPTLTVNPPPAEDAIMVGVQSFRNQKSVTTLELTYEPAVDYPAKVFKNGILLRAPDHYTILDNVITLAEASSAEGDDFDVDYAWEV